MQSARRVTGLALGAGLLAGMVAALVFTGLGLIFRTGAADRSGEFLKILPSADREEPAAAPHLGPVAARAAAQAFLAEPAPGDAALAALAPFTGAANRPVSSCGKEIPQGVRDELLDAAPTIERRLKSEIYGLLNLRQVLTTGDCSCTGKVAPWEPVPLILAAFERRNGVPQPVDAYALRDEALRLRRAVERLCGGPF